MKLKKLFWLLPVTFLAVSAVVSFACTCSTCGKQEEVEVPKEILQTGNDFIISKTGRQFFDNYISPDFSLTKKNGGVYEMAYRFIMPEKSFVDEVIRFSIDSTGKVLEEREIIGIPDCTNDPNGCGFSITEEQVRTIAKENGLKEGVNDWKVGFMWDEKTQQYVWHVLNTLYESEGSQGYIGNGEEIVIDPNTGLVIRQNKWNIR